MTADLAAGVNWGSVPDWVAAIGTVSAFVLAAIGYIWSVSISRKAQARKIVIDPATYEHHPAGRPFVLDPATMWPNILWDEEKHGKVVPGKQVIIATVKITNLSDEAMGPLVIELVAGDTFIEAAAEHTARIGPSEHMSFKFGLENTWHPSPASIQTRIVFRDAAGRWWQRFENEPITRAPKSIRPPLFDPEAARRIKRTKTSRFML